MKVMSTKWLVSLSLLLVVFLSVPLSAQDLSIGTDIVSRYIWRGFDLGQNTPSIQPTIEFSTGGFTAGFWGAWATANDVTNEIDIYASYAFDLSTAGGLSLEVTDYTNPNDGTKIGNFNNYDNANGPGAHFLEGNINYSGPGSFPISLSFNFFFYNVANNPIYFEAGYGATVKDVGIDFFVGGTPGEKGYYYAVNNFSIINTGIKVSKEIKITDSFSLPVFGSVILNPATENMYYVLGISL